MVSNFALLVAVTLVPLYFYSKSDRVPKTDEDLSKSVTEFAPETQANAAKRSKEMSEFWKKRGAVAGHVKDADFSQLLRAGKSSMKRHYELTGPLAEQEAAQKQKEADDVKK